MTNKKMGKTVVTLMIVFINLAIITSTGFTEPIPDTGQTLCYDNTQQISCPSEGEPFYGQDGTVETVQPSYTKLDASGNELPSSASSWAMIRDNVTGLIWEAKTDDGTIHDIDNIYEWLDIEGSFIDVLNSENFGGFSNWRLPTVNELHMLVDRGNVSPAINVFYFPLTASSFYWSKTPAISSGHWCVSFSNGESRSRGDTNETYVRAVVGEEMFNNLLPNGDGTVTDSETGLMWQVGHSSGTWEQALAYCANLNLAEYGDWRLPNAHELVTLVDYSSENPAIKTVYFPDSAIHYWTSTTYVGNTAQAHRVTFEDGRLYFSTSKNLGTQLVYARCLRGGNPRDHSDLMCKGNFDFDTDVDGGDAFVFKTHFGRSLFKNPCPPDGPSPVERTWQTDCYDESGTDIDCTGTGQDAEHRRGVDLPDGKTRFADNVDGTVTDNLTGLRWLKDANCFGQRIWNDALSDCNGLADGQCGLSDGSQAGDWRLPNYKELFSLIDVTQLSPTLPFEHPFNNVESNQYWTSTSGFYPGSSHNAYYYQMTYGTVGFIGKGNPYYVWPVRGGH